MPTDHLTCEQSLAALATAPVQDITGDSPVARHARSCPDCARVASVVLERERSMSLGLDGLTPRANVAEFADQSLVARHRQGIGQFVTWLLIGALAVSSWIGFNRMRGADHPSEPRATLVETFETKCLPPGALHDLVMPYLASIGSSFSSAPLGVNGVTVRGTPGELASIRAVLVRFDIPGSSACSVRQPTPAPKTP